MSNKTRGYVDTDNRIHQLIKRLFKARNKMNIFFHRLTIRLYMTHTCLRVVKESFYLFYPLPEVHTESSGYHGFK
jgi:hypothetical protein